MDLTIDIPLYDVSGGPFAKGKAGKWKGKEEELVEDPVNLKNREVKERLAKAEERCVCLGMGLFGDTILTGYDYMIVQGMKTPCGPK
jgi:hypothetical protein